MKQWTWTLAVAFLLGTLVGCEPETPAPSSTTTDAAATEVSFEAGEEVTLDVPSMHCPFACWPKVQETLAAQEGVEEVRLAEQKDENAIDNPKVHVKLNGKFAANEAIEALADAGFDDATIGQN